MTAKGHVVLASALAYAPLKMIYPVLNFVEITLLYIVVLFGSLLPDIDEPNSYIGNKSFYISNFLKLLGLKHRTFTHWLITPFIFVCIGYLFGGFYSYLLYALAFGVLAHDIGDLLTKGGIKGFFFPLFPNTRIGLLPRTLRFETFSLTEKFLVLMLFFTNGFIYTSFLEVWDATYFQKLLSL